MLLCAPVVRRNLHKGNCKSLGLVIKKKNNDLFSSITFAVVLRQLFSVVTIHHPENIMGKILLITSGKIDLLSN